MAPKHLTLEVLERLVRGERPRREDLQELVEHHLAVCAVCRGAYEALARKERAQRRSVAQVVARVISGLSGRSLALARLELDAEEELRELMQLEGAVRRARINRAITRFRNPILVDKLLEASRRKVKGDAVEACALAECAHDVALRVPASKLGPRWAMTCLARSAAYRGNALRVAGELKQAEQLLEFAVELLRQEGNGDPLAEAELLWILSSLRREQGRFEEAVMHLDVARGLYEDCGAVEEIGGVLVSQAMVLSEAGETARATTAAQEAVRRTDRAENPEQYLAAQHELTLCLAQEGRVEEARGLLEENAPLYQQFPDAWTQLRLRWLTGKVARGLGRTAEAEGVLIEVREELLAMGLGFEAALAGLDLSLVYLDQGRTHRVRELAEEMVPIFLAQDIQREATAALLLIQEAAR